MQRIGEEEHGTSSHSKENRQDGYRVGGIPQTMP